MREIKETREVTVGTRYSCKHDRAEYSVDVKNGKITHADWNHSGVYYDINSKPYNSDCIHDCLKIIYEYNYPEFCQLLKALDKSSMGYAIAKKIVEADISYLEREISSRKSLL